MGDVPLRQSLYSRLAGYEDTNDAERLSVDPAMRQVVGGRATKHTAASTSQMGRFETEVLTQPKNLKALTKMSGKGSVLRKGVGSPCWHISVVFLHFEHTLTGMARQLRLQYPGAIYL